MTVPFVPIESMELAAWNVQRGACATCVVVAHNTTVERRMWDIPSLSNGQRSTDVLDALISTIK